MYKISIQYTISFKRYRTETIFQSWKFFKVEKGHNSQNNLWILPWIELNLHFMIIYLCIIFQSNTPILSKGIALKPKVLPTGRTGQRYIQSAVILYAPPTENGGGIKTGVYTGIPYFSYFLLQNIGGGRVVRRCCVSYITGASNWYWLTVGQGLLSL